MAEMEYWCEVCEKWVPELRIVYGVPRCEPCGGGGFSLWYGARPIVREKKPEQYEASQISLDEWRVRKILTGSATDFALTESQAREIAALRNKWEGENG